MSPLGTVNKDPYGFKVYGSQEAEHMLFTVQGKKEKVLEFYRMWVFCQKCSFSETCPPPPFAEPRVCTKAYIRKYILTFILLNTQKKKEKIEQIINISEWWNYSRSHLILQTIKLLKPYIQRRLLWCYFCFPRGAKWLFNQSWRIETFS